MTTVIVEVIGWSGSALLVISLFQSRMLTLRVLNLLAALVLIGYNAALAVWPSVALNVAVAVIDAYYLIAWRTRSARVTTAEQTEVTTEGES
ncbi:hypothetical protein [Humibacter ginsengisoli]